MQRPELQMFWSVAVSCSSGCQVASRMPIPHLSAEGCSAVPRDGLGAFLTQLHFRWERPPALLTMTECLLGCAGDLEYPCSLLQHRSLSSRLPCHGIFIVCRGTIGTYMSIL